LTHISPFWQIYVSNDRIQQTRERLRTAAHRLFLQQGYPATSIDAILAEAGISSKETLYRHYTNKEALFVDVLSHLTMEQPGFSEKLAALPTPHDLPSLRQALMVEINQLARQLGRLRTVDEPFDDHASW
jgi:AcrR family transcriptional regulator